MTRVEKYSTLERQIIVPIDTVAISTDRDGNICAFSGEIQKCHEPNGVWYTKSGIVRIVGKFEYTGDWRESLMVLNQLTVLAA